MCGIGIRTFEKSLKDFDEANHYKKNMYFLLIFATQISLVALDKSHETLVANDKRYWMKEEINKYKFIF